MTSPKPARKTKKRAGVSGWMQAADRDDLEQELYLILHRC